MGGRGSDTFSKQPKASNEQLRMAKMIQTTKEMPNDDGNAEERRSGKLVKKIMEATRCSQMEAEIALFDADNNVDAAVLSIIEKAEEESMWTKNKSRKTGKDEKLDQRYSTGRPSRSGRGGAVNGERRGRGSQRGGAGGNPRGDRPLTERAGTEGTQSSADRGAPRRGRGGRGAGRGAGRDGNGNKANRHDGAEPAQNTNERFSKNDDSEEFNWHNRNKDKPLVFTRTEKPVSSSKGVDSEPASASEDTSGRKEVPVPEAVPGPKPITVCAAGPVSFAAAAAGRRGAPPKSNPGSSNEESPVAKTSPERDLTDEDASTPVVYQSPVMSSPPPTDNDEPEAVEENEAEPSMAELSLNEQPDEVPAEKSSSVEPEVSDPVQEVSEEQTPVWDEKPSVAPEPVHPPPKKVAEVVAVQAHNCQLWNDAPSEPKTYTTRSIGQQSSYRDTKNLSFPSESYAPPQVSRQQPQPPQSPQHPVYPPQVPYGNMPYMNPMYNPMGNMRSEDQFNAAAAFMHNYQSLMGGMGAFDMTALAAAMNTAPAAATQQHQQQRYDNVYDHKNYHGSNTGAGAGSSMSQMRPDNASSMLPNTAVPPPPGFSGPPTNVGHYIQPPQQNMAASMFAMSQQYPHQFQFPFLMPNVSGNSQPYAMQQQQYPAQGTSQQYPGQGTSQHYTMQQQQYPAQGTSQQYPGQGTSQQYTMQQQQYPAQGNSQQYTMQQQQYPTGQIPYQFMMPSVSRNQ